MLETTTNPQPEATDISSNITIKNNLKRAETLMSVFWVLIALTFIGVISGYMEYLLLLDIQNGVVFIDDERINNNDLRQSVIGISQTALYIASAVVFIMWFRRAYANLHRMRIKTLRHSESLALWGWIIPIVSLFWPVQIMNDIWEESQSQIKIRDKNYIIQSGGLIIGLWWTLFIISNIIGRYIMRTVFKTETIDEIINSSIAMTTSDMLQVIEGLLVILIVRRLSKIETKLAYEIIKTGGRVVDK